MYDDDAKRPAAGSAALRPAPDGRILTTAGGFVLLGGGALVAGILDALLLHTIGWILGPALVLGSMYVAARLRSADLFTALVAPPLVFVVAVAVALQLLPAAEGDGWLTRQVVGIMMTLAAGAPILWASELGAVLILVLRRRREQGLRH